MTSRFFLRRTLLLLLGVTLWACAPLATATPFIPPTAQPPLIEPTLIIQPTKEVVVVQSTPITTVTIPTATPNPTDCINDLKFVSDLTIPDGTSITYGATIDKQWQVQNSGTCNWDSRYSLRFVKGAQLGAPDSLALYPAKSGTTVTLQITFTAPFTDGDYESAWQAFDPNGVAFGELVYMRITVVSP